MNKTLHWAVSIAVSAIAGVAIFIIVACLGVIAYWLVVKAWPLLLLVVGFVFLLWCGHVIDKHGFAWSPKSRSE